MTNPINEWRRAYSAKTNQECDLNEPQILKIIELEEELATNHDCITSLKDKGIFSDGELRIYSERCFSVFLEKIVKVCGENICREMYDYLPWERIGFLEEESSFHKESAAHGPTRITESLERISNDLFAFDYIANEINDLGSVRLYGRGFEDAARSLSIKTTTLNKNIRGTFGNVLVTVIRQHEDIGRLSESLKGLSSLTKTYRVTKFGAKKPFKDERISKQRAEKLARGVLKLSGEVFELRTSDDEITELKSMLSSIHANTTVNRDT